MTLEQIGWVDFLRSHNTEFLQWIHKEEVLTSRFEELASTVSTVLQRMVSTPQVAREVWEASPAVLSRCGDPATFQMPGAAVAFAWLHLLDRYVRTWVALEELVEASCISMGRHGVRTLDIGTGPGSSAFAIVDFYHAMTEFAESSGLSQWQQPSNVTCVEFNCNFNRLRHIIAETLHVHSEGQREEVLSLCGSLGDFRSHHPVQERKEFCDRLREEEDLRFEDEEGQWEGERVYSAAEANSIAQRLHRYHLVVFSNVLTTLESLAELQPNLIDTLADCHPGLVTLFIGGKGPPYPQIHEHVDRLAKRTGFQIEIARVEISSASTAVAHRVHEEGLRFYRHLQHLSHNADSEIGVIHAHFSQKPSSPPSSELKAYRKYRSS